MNYKVGDLVKITGNYNGHWFKIGETVRLKEYRGGMNHVWEAEYLDGHDWWNVRECDVIPAKPAIMPQKIVVTTDGKTTLARLFDGKKMVKRAEAKCAPSDVFDFGIGAELAVKRLMGAKPVTEPIKESEPVKLYCVKGFKPGEWLTKGKVYDLRANGTVEMDDGYRTTLDDVPLGGLPFSKYFCKLVRRPAKVGEWVYVAEIGGVGGNSQYEAGRIYRVFATGSENCVWFANDGKGNIRKENYLVLSGYTGDPA